MFIHCLQSKVENGDEDVNSAESNVEVINEYANNLLEVGTVPVKFSCLLVVDNLF